MTPEKTIKCCLIYYPTLFSNRADVLNHLFLTVGNGYEWVNGELVCKDDMDKDINICSGIDNIVSELKDWKGDILFKTPIDIKVSLFLDFIKESNESDQEAGTEEFIEDLTKHIIQRVEKILGEVKDISRFEEIYKLPLRLEKSCGLYPLCEFSKIMNIPSDITPEWKSCIKEFYDYIMTSEEKVIVNYRKQYKNELIKLKEYGI